MPFVWQYSSSDTSVGSYLKDTTLFTIVCGLHETEYGYTSVNEMESVKVDGSKYGVDEIFQVEQLDGFKPVKLKSIPDEDLQAFLHNME